MFDINAATILILSLLVLVVAGVHIAIALGISSALGIYLATGDFAVVHKMLGLVKGSRNRQTPALRAAPMKTDER